MKTTLINYADRDFYRAQRINCETGLRVGGFDHVIACNRHSMEPKFRDRHRETLMLPRGAGYWLWKPYIMLRALREAVAQGDMLFYCDSGCRFIAPIAPLIEHCLRDTEKPVLLFTLTANHTNGRWTKRDCFLALDVEDPEIVAAPQIVSTFILCRNVPFTVDLIAQWLTLAENPQLLTDAPNACGVPNYPDFIEHRHDQSLLSLLGYKHRIQTLPDISQWGNADRKDIPQFIHHTREHDRDIVIEG